MTERTVITTIEVTEVNKDVPDDATINKEGRIKFIKHRVKQLLDADDVVVTNIQEFIRDNAVDEMQKENNNGWIPCSERLPRKEELSKRKEVIVQNRYGEVFTAKYGYNSTHTHQAFFGNYTAIPYVTHWQPLPAPYKEEGAE